MQIAPARGRQAISYLTLFGAFASSVFWVLGHYFNEAYGWRRTLVLFALINAGVCLPLILAGLARRDERAAGPAVEAAPSATRDGPPLQGRARRIAIALFAAIMSLNGFVFGVVTVQLVPLLEAAGLTAAAAVWIASLKGFAQFGGRVVEISFGRKLRAITVARLAIGVLPLSFLLLLSARRQRPGDPRVHAADGRLAGRDHHRARGGAARALWRQRLRRGARVHRDADPGGQRGLAVAVRAGGRPLGLAGGAACAARLRVGVLRWRWN